MFEDDGNVNNLLISLACWLGIAYIWLLALALGLCE
jgi:hypothetical protein